jgi:hypothetical protein
MAPGTSPSITGLLNAGETITDGGYYIGFHASTGTLWTYDFNDYLGTGIHTSNGNTGYGKAAGTSPSTTADL